MGVEHGEAWSCVELSVIDAGNGRLVEALSLLDEAVELFGHLGDRRGLDWAVFLRATIQRCSPRTVSPAPARRWARCSATPIRAGPGP